MGDIDEDDPGGQLVFHVLARLAEFEGCPIGDRTTLAWLPPARVEAPVTTPVIVGRPGLAGDAPAALQAISTARTVPASPYPAPALSDPLRLPNHSGVATIAS